MGSPGLFASCLPLIATPKEFQAFLGWLFKTRTYGTKERGFFQHFLSKLKSYTFFSKKICCRVSCLGIVTSMVLFCVERVAPRRDVPGLCLVLTKHWEQSGAFGRARVTAAELQRFGYWFYCL